MTWSPVTDQLSWDDVGGRLLANLARGIYSHEAVVREYVQNAADSYKHLETPPEEPTIIIAPSGNDLCIQDSGIGMNEKDIRDSKKIAVSTKADIEDMVGFRGIGIWAGFQACEALVVDSTRLGNRKRYRLTIDFAEILSRVDDNINIKKLVDPRYRIECTAAEKDEHYTRVTLKNVQEDFSKLLDEEELTRIISQILPSRVDPEFQYHDELVELLANWPSYHDFPIKLRTKSGLTEVFRQFPGKQQLEPPQEDLIKSDEGLELGRFWYCRTKKTSLKADPPAIRGFRLRVRNFAVGPINIYNAEQGHTYAIQNNLDLKTVGRLNWFCGELHVTNNAILPNTPRDDLERDQAARVFIEQVRGIYKERINEAGAYSDFNPFRKALTEGEKYNETFKNGSPNTDDIPKIRQCIEKLEQVASKSKGSSKDQGTNLFKNLLRQAWFKNRVKKVLPKLRKLSPVETKSSKPSTNKKSSKKDGGSSTGTAATQNATNAPQKVGSFALSVEEIFSEVMEVLERRLGVDHDEYEAIAEEIEQILFARIGDDAKE